MLCQFHETIAQEGKSHLQGKQHRTGAAAEDGLAEATVTWLLDDEVEQEEEAGGADST